MFEATIGTKCKYSSTLDGIIPVEYIGMQTGSLPFSRPRPTFRVAKQVGPFSKGELIRDDRYVTPNECFVKTGQFTYTRKPFKWVD